jgi:hypothetical protein
MKLTRKNYYVLLCDEGERDHTAEDWLVCGVYTSKHDAEVVAADIDAL